MRVVVTGATGMVGTGVLRALAADPEIDEIVGIARRRPEVLFDNVRWEPLDVLTADLEPILTGAGAVVHLAWLIQPQRDTERTWAHNVGGTERVLAACAQARVPVAAYSSSVGCYSPGPDGDRPVDESWPTAGLESLAYSREKAHLERLCERFE